VERQPSAPVLMKPFASIQRETSSKPFLVGIGAGHHEHVLDLAGFARSRLGVVQDDALKVRVAFEGFDRGPCHERNLLVRFDSGNQVSRLLVIS